MEKDIEALLVSKQQDEDHHSEEEEGSPKKRRRHSSNLDEAMKDADTDMTVHEAELGCEVQLKQETVTMDDSNANQGMEMEATETSPAKHQPSEVNQEETTEPMNTEDATLAHPINHGEEQVVPEAANS